MGKRSPIRTRQEREMVAGERRGRDTGSSSGGGNTDQVHLELKVSKSAYTSCLKQLTPTLFFMENTEKTDKVNFANTLDIR